MVSPEASQFFMRKISRRSCCDWYNCVGFYVTDENTKIREARCDQPRDITDLLLCMPSEATTFDFNVSHVRHSRKYTQQSRCRDAHHADEMRHASGARASCYQNCLLHAWRLRSCGLPSKPPAQSGRLLSQPIKIKRKSTPHKRNNGSKCQPHEVDSQLYQ